jgi:hypothetical protein
MIENRSIIVTKLARRAIRVGVAASLVLSSATSAFAGTSDVGGISGVLPHYAGLLFNQSGTRYSAPACATLSGRWVINVGTPQGQAMAAALLTSYMAHKRITVVGTGDCGVWSDTETVAYFRIED